MDVLLSKLELPLFILVQPGDMIVSRLVVEKLDERVLEKLPSCQPLFHVLLQTALNEVS